MDRLAPHPSWGETLGLLATTYELQPDFVETDFLPTLLGLGAWDDRSWSGRIALERKLACMESAALLQDARCYARRPRSLRLEHRLATGPQGQELHAKVVVVVHEHAVRMLVGSANLTEPGHRRNREVVTVVVATAADAAAGGLIREALTQRPAALERWWTRGAERVAQRALAKLEEWKAPPAVAGARFAWSGPGDALWQRFVNAWPSGRRIERLFVVSPFWSEEDGDDAPLAALLTAIADRALLAKGAEVALRTEMRRDTGGEARPVLPASFAGFDAKRFGVRAVAEAVDPAVLPEEVGMRTDFSGARALHAKIVVAEGKGATLAYVGSANFTRRGWGFLQDPARANIEAGLLLLREGRDAETLQSMMPATIGDAVVLSASAGSSLVSPDPVTQERAWPDFVRDVRLVPSQEHGDRLDLVVQLDSARVEGAWSLRIPDSPSAPLCERSPGSRDDSIEIALDEGQLRDLLRAQEVEVQWWASAATAVLPLNVDLAARDELPLSPGERPEEHLILAYYQGRITWEDLFPPPPDWAPPGEDEWEPPPESGVDTSRIQSYQVREFVESLAGIRSDLRGASVSEAAMRLALSGPVSPVALARQIAAAVHDGRRSVTAGAFELVELIACVREARSLSVSDGLRTVWQAEVDRALAEIERHLDALRSQHAAELGPASKFARYQRVIADQARARSLG